MESINNKLSTQKKSPLSLPTMLVIFGLLVVVGVLWAPIGLKPTGLFDEWRRLDEFDRLTLGDLNHSGARPLVRLIRWIPSALTPGATTGLDYLTLLMFFIKGLMAYQIMHMLTLGNRAAAFVIGVLFILYPAEGDPFSMQNAPNQISFTCYLIAVCLLFTSYKKYSLLRLRVMILFLVTSLMVYETAYTTAFFVPLLLVWLDKGFTKRVMRVAAVWYAALLICLVYTLNFYLDAFTRPRSYVSKYSVVDEKTPLELVEKVVDAMLKAYARHFGGGWFEAFNELGSITVYHVFALVLALIVGAVVIYLLSHSNFQAAGQNIRRYGILFAIGIMALGLDFGPYSLAAGGYTWRIYTRSSMGAALCVVMVALIIIHLVRNPTIRKSIFVGLTIVAVYAATVWSLFKHETLAQRVLFLQEVLADVAVQVPDIEDNTAVIVILDPNFPNFPLRTFRHTEAAVRILYDNKTLALNICNSPVAQSERQDDLHGNCKFQQDRLLIDFVEGRDRFYDYNNLVLFQFVWPSDMQLIEEIPADFTADIRVEGYDPYQRIDLDATMPARTQVMFLDWPVDEFLCDDTPVPLVNCDNFKAEKVANYAKAHFVRGEIDSSLESLSLAIRYAPDDARLYRDRGNIYFQQKELNLALADYNRVLELDPKNFNAYTRRAQIYQQQKELDLALADYNRALELVPTNAGVYLRRAQIYHQQGILDLALADYTKSIELNSDSAISYLRRGSAYEQQATLDLALLDYTQAIELDPALAQAYASRGGAYYKLEQFDLALVDYQRYLELNGDQVDPIIAERIQELESRSS